jgi:hypothetical protein
VSRSFAGLIARPKENPRHRDVLMGTGRARASVKTRRAADEIARRTCITVESQTRPVPKRGDVSDRLDARCIER